MEHKGKQREVPDCSSQESLHYICMRVQVGLAMNMNNKTVVSAAVSISSALRKNPADRPLERSCSCSRRCRATPGRGGTGLSQRASWLTDSMTCCISAEAHMHAFRPVPCEPPHRMQRWLGHGGKSERSGFL